MYLGDNRFYVHVGYGSKYDESIINFNLCCDCYDKVIDMILPMCKIDPFVGEY